MKRSDEIIEAIDLAIANKACVLGILGASYPNGPNTLGACRDIQMDLDEPTSARVLEAIKSALAPSKD